MPAPQLVDLRARWFGQAATAFVHSGPILERYQEAARLSQQDLHSEINPRDWRFREIKKARLPPIRSACS